MLRVKVWSFEGSELFSIGRYRFSKFNLPEWNNENAMNLETDELIVNWVLCYSPIAIRDFDNVLSGKFTDSERNFFIFLNHYWLLLVLYYSKSYSKINPSSIIWQIHFLSTKNLSVQIREINISKHYKNNALK